MRLLALLPHIDLKPYDVINIRNKNQIKNLQQEITKVNIELDIHNNRIKEYNDLDARYSFKLRTLLEIAESINELELQTHHLERFGNYSNVFHDFWFANLKNEISSFQNYASAYYQERINLNLLTISIKYQLAVCKKISLGPEDKLINNFITENYNELVNNINNINVLENLHKKIFNITQKINEDLKYFANLGRMSNHTQTNSFNLNKSRIIKNLLKQLPIEERVDIFSTKNEDEVSIEVRQIRTVLQDEDYEFGKVLADFNI